jgi:predicted nucleic acid-binding protein
MIWQVIAVFMRHLRWWRDQGRISNAAVRKYAQVSQRLWPISLPSPTILNRALDLADAHSLSHWDSMLVAACMEAGVDTLYTEDMGSPRVIESLRLENPFI